MKTRLLLSVLCLLSAVTISCRMTAEPPTATPIPTPLPTQTATPTPVPTVTPSPTPIAVTDSSCKIISVVQISSGDELPTFEYKAEGFAPGEGVNVILKGGSVQVAGLTMTLATAKFTSADEEGRIQGTIVVSLISAEPVEYPAEFELGLMGSENNCDVSEDVPWSP